MKFKVNDSAPHAPTPHLCAHCGERCSGSVQVFLHIGDNPPHGRPRVNVISQGFAFCNSACRSAWWDTPTADALLPAPEEVASAHPLGATLFHVDPHSADRAVEIVDNAGHLLAMQKGEPVAHFELANGEQLEAWWRGETDVAEIPLPVAES